MVQYRTTTKSASGEREYAKLVGDIWEPITEDEAKQAGVWKDPRGGQFGVKDELATPEQLTARHEGRYDPRPASGSLVAVRVNFRCCRCGTVLGEAVEFEHRILYHSKREGTWTRRPSGLKCRACFAPLEFFGIGADEIDHAVAQARVTGKPTTLRLGDLPKDTPIPGNGAFGAS